MKKLDGKGWAGRRIAEHALLFGPRTLALIPALALCAFWLGGEIALLAVAIALPAAIALFETFDRRGEEASADLDAATGLPGKDTAERTVSRLLAEGPTRARTVAVLAFEIDEYADLTARHGSDAATHVLKACAGRLQTSIRKRDLVVRLDGPRFAVVLATEGPADLETLIQLSARIQRQIEAPIAVDGKRLFVTASVGFSTPRICPDTDAEGLIQAARQALMDAVSNGTGVIRAFTHDIQRRARALSALAEDLPQALANGQITPWFQPQISTETGAVSGFEVLARWQHPERGLIPPAQFLSTVEQLGLLERLGEVMLGHALDALRTWDAAGIEVPNLSVNFSGEELRNPQIVDNIRWELDRYGIAPERLTVEVLETVIAQTTHDTIVRNLRAFADLGCGVDLDDFGTGHASIANIKRFSVGRIKIDRSFVTEIDTDLEQQNIVAAILTLADRLGLETLAECVETEPERAVLSRLGCDFLQGYGIARPMPFEVVDAWLEAHRAELSQGSDAPPQARQTRGKTA